MGVSVGLKDLPRPVQGTVLGTVLILSALAILTGLGAFVRSEARAEATTTTKTVLAQDIESFKREAKVAAENAAREGAERAVREAVGPLASEIQEVKVREVGHEREDDARQRATDEAIRELKQHVR